MLCFLLLILMQHFLALQTITLDEIKESTANM